MDTHHISTQHLSFSELKTILDDDLPIALSEDVKLRIQRCRTYLDETLDTSDTPIYGINTGFGSLHKVKISKSNLTQLQDNLVMSHACGTGELVPAQVVKIMLLLKIQSLSYGHSGVQLQTVERLVDFYNNDILPVVYTQGSLGASGDLAPLAHLALPLIGKGEVFYKGERVSVDSIYSTFNWTPINLQSKEGLALLNGTQFMSAYGVYTIIKAHKLSYLADLIATLSLEAFDGTAEPFTDLIHLVRPHNGQLKTAERIREFLEDSELIQQPNKKVQDPYSFRCVPQVHGATKDALAYVTKVFETEINAVTDNPNIFVDDNRIISGGNFHGQPLAIAFDTLKIAMAELGNISERRTFQLVSGLRGLPEFLVNNPGLNSGFMIPQYTAASIVSANKQLASPASIDSIVSSNGQEDHVSMGANGATQTYRLINNVERILAIELFNASQALYFRLPLKTSPFLEQFLLAYRQDVSFVEDDIIMYDKINSTVNFLNTVNLENSLLF